MKEREREGERIKGRDIGVCMWDQYRKSRLKLVTCTCFPYGVQTNSTLSPIQSNTTTKKSHYSKAIIKSPLHGFGTSCAFHP